MKTVLFLMMVLILNLAAGDYQAESIALFARMTSSSPDVDRKWGIDSEIRSLKELGLFAKTDWLCLLANQDEQASLLNWIEDNNNVTAVNSPTFVIDAGWNGNGTTSYLNSNYIISTDAINVGAQSYTFGLAFSTNATRAGAHGVRQGSFELEIVPKFTDNKFYLRIGNPTALSGAQTSTMGIFVDTRRTSADAEGYYNSGTIITSAVTGQALGTLAMYLGSYNTNGTAAQFDTRQMRASWVSAGLTDQEVADYSTCIEAFLDYIGAGVIAGTTEFPYESLFTEEETTEVKRTFDIFGGFKIW